MKLIPLFLGTKVKEPRPDFRTITFDAALLPNSRFWQTGNTIGWRCDELFPKSLIIVDTTHELGTSLDTPAVTTLDLKATGRVYGYLTENQITTRLSAEDGGYRVYVKVQFDGVLVVTPQVGDRLNVVEVFSLKDSSTRDIFLAAKAELHDDLVEAWLEVRDSKGAYVSSERMVFQIGYPLTFDLTAIDKSFSLEVNGEVKSITLTDPYIDTGEAEFALFHVPSYPFEVLDKVRLYKFRLEKL